ncbi:MAG: hypothetical protein JWM34_4129 [Ilumatobacteraceae bacterium]|nr:hypothetical protein [Ilumatobacteraceae bacterium]
MVRDLLVSAATTKVPASGRQRSRTWLLVGAILASVTAVTGTVVATAVAADGPTGSYDALVTNSANFPRDLAASRAILNGLSIGDPCTASTDHYLADPSSPQPLLVGFADFSSGQCLIGGWAYRVLPPDLLPGLPRWAKNDQFVLVPVFDDDGKILQYMDPPDTVVDNVVVDG